MAIDWKMKLNLNDGDINTLRFTGYFFLRQGHYDIATKYFQALTILEPSSLYDNQTLGALYLQVNNPTEALKYLNRALKLSPNEEYTQLNRAKALLMMGLNNEGLAAARQLERSTNPAVSGDAQALQMAYTR